MNPECRHYDPLLPFHSNRNSNACAEHTERLWCYRRQGRASARGRIRHFSAVPAALRWFALLSLMLGASAQAAIEARVVLTGTARSKQEGAMEGVSIIAQRIGSAVLTSVMTDARGVYRFPGDRLPAGRYTLSIRAAGYELATPTTVVVSTTAGAPKRLDLNLSSVTSPTLLAHQLTNLEWINSMPGTPSEKDMLVRNIVNCGFCHTLERVVTSQHSAAEFLSVIQRMETYSVDYTSAERAQLWSVSPPLEGLRYNGFDAMALAQYLATVNLSGGRTSLAYPLKFMPRPKGNATHLIVTVYPIPRQPSVIHDLDVDSKGNVWYGNSGWNYIGKLDPHSGRFQEWAAPDYRAPPVAGLPPVQGVVDVQVDGGDRVWTAIGGTKMAVFDPKSERWATYDLPISTRRSGFISPFHNGEDTIWTTGIPAGVAGSPSLQQAFRLHISSGQVDEGIPLFRDLPPPEDPLRSGTFHGCYMMDRDSNDNFVCTDFFGSNIVYVDTLARTVSIYPTPTPWSFPRRGYFDREDRFWFGEFYADKIGVFNAKTREILEYPVPTKYISPYYARPDDRGNVWVSSNGSDRVIRLDDRTGDTVQYLLPVYCDARKLVVDRSAPRTTIWLPNKNTAQLIRVEFLD
jgi:virginiamycin B lyase